MTLQYSEMALSGNGWNLDAAWKNFEELKVSKIVTTHSNRWYFRC
jgi:nuclear RNA export factor